MLPAYISIVGTAVPNPYGAGTWTVESLSIEPNWITAEPEVVAVIRWQGTDNPVLDDQTTEATLAPGTPLWDALTRYARNLY